MSSTRSCVTVTVGGVVLVAAGIAALFVGGKAGDYVKVEPHASMNVRSFTQMYWVKADPKIESSIGDMSQSILGPLLQAAFE